MSSSACEVVRTTTGMRFRSRVRLDLGQHLAAVLLRQVQVEQDQVRARARRRTRPRGAGTPAPPRRPRRRCSVLRTLPSLQRLARQAHVAGVVLHQQDLDRLGPSDPRSCALLPRAPASVKKNVEPSPGLRLDPDAAAVALDDLLADRQADAGARVLVAAVQALEDHEDALDVLRRRCRCRCRAREDCHSPPVAAAPRRGCAAARPAAELDRVADQVLEQLRRAALSSASDRRAAGRASTAAPLSSIAAPQVDERPVERLPRQSAGCELPSRACRRASRRAGR